MQISDRKDDLFFFPCLSTIYHSGVLTRIPMCTHNLSHKLQSFIPHDLYHCVSSLCIVCVPLRPHDELLRPCCAGWEFYQSDLQVWNCQEGEETAGNSQILWAAVLCNVYYITFQSVRAYNHIMSIFVCENQYYTLPANFYNFTTNFATYAFQ